MKRLYSPIGSTEVEVPESLAEKLKAKGYTDTKPAAKKSASKKDTKPAAKKSASKKDTKPAAKPED